MNDDKSDRTQPAPSSLSTHAERASPRISWTEIARFVAQARVGVMFFDALEAERVAGHITDDVAARVFDTVVQSHDNLPGAFELARAILNKN